MIKIDVSTLVAVVVAAYLVGGAFCTWAFWPLMAPGLANNTRASALKTLQVVLAAAVSRWERPSSPTPASAPAPEVPESGGYAALPEMERKVVDHIVARLHLGLRQYGPLKVGDPRDWRAEARDEIYDAIVYRALDSMHVDRLGGHPGGAPGLKRDTEAAQAEGDRKTSDHVHELGACSFCDRKDAPASSGVLGPCQLT